MLWIDRVLGPVHVARGAREGVTRGRGLRSLVASVEDPPLLASEVKLVHRMRDEQYQHKVRIVERWLIVFACAAGTSCVGRLRCSRAWLRECAARRRPEARPHVFHGAAQQRILAARGGQHSMARDAKLDAGLVQPPARLHRRQRAVSPAEVPVLCRPIVCDKHQAARVATCEFGGQKATKHDCAARGATRVRINRRNLDVLPLCFAAIPSALGASMVERLLERLHPWRSERNVWWCNRCNRCCRRRFVACRYPRLLSASAPCHG